MFERFTDRARRVVVMAQEECRRLCHDSIGTEHLLLGMLRDSESTAAKALEQLGIDLAAMRVAVEAAVPPGAEQPRSMIPFTPGAKKVMELSLREALKLGHDEIGTEHLLLGLVRDGGGTAGQILSQHGADKAKVNAAVLELLEGTTGTKSSRRARVTVKRVPASREPSERWTPDSWTPGAGAVLAIARQMAGDQPIGTQHLLKALVAITGTAAHGVLWAGAFDPSAIPAEWDVTGTLDEPPEDKAARQVEVEAGGEVLQVRIRDGLREVLLAALQEGRLDLRTLAERFGETALSLGEDAGSSAAAPAGDDDPGGEDDPGGDDDPGGEDDPASD